MGITSRFQSTGFGTTGMGFNPTTATGESAMSKQQLKREVSFAIETSNNSSRQFNGAIYSWGGSQTWSSSESSSNSADEEEEVESTKSECDGSTDSLNVMTSPLVELVLNLRTKCIVKGIGLVPTTEYVKRPGVHD